MAKVGPKATAIMSGVFKVFVLTITSLLKSLVAIIVF